MIEYIFVALLGLIFGSFASVLVVRIPASKSIVFPPSACTACDTKLRWFHNIPLLSYLFLRGKCANCTSKISPLYPILELISMFLALIIYAKLGLNPLAFFVFIMFLLLLALSTIDFIHMAVPDSLNFSALFFALLASNFALESLSNALIIAGGLALLRMIVSMIVHKEAMGEADIIIGATMGAFLGLKGALIALFLASVIAIIPAIIRKRSGIEETPFIPFLSIGILLAFLYQNKIVMLLGW